MKSKDSTEIAVLSRKCMVTFSHHVLVPQNNGDPVFIDGAICNVPDNFRDYGTNVMEIVSLLPDRMLTKTLRLTCMPNTIFAIVEIEQGDPV